MVCGHLLSAPKKLPSDFLQGSLLTTNSGNFFVYFSICEYLHFTFLFDSLPDIKSLADGVFFFFNLSGLWICHPFLCLLASTVSSKKTAVNLTKILLQSESFFSCCFQSFLICLGVYAFWLGYLGVYRVFFGCGDCFSSNLGHFQHYFFQYFFQFLSLPVLIAPAYLEVFNGAHLSLRPVRSLHFFLLSSELHNLHHSIIKCTCSIFQLTSTVVVLQWMLNASDLTFQLQDVPLVPFTLPIYLYSLVAQTLSSDLSLLP